VCTKYCCKSLNKQSCGVQERINPFFINSYGEISFGLRTFRFTNDLQERIMFVNQGLTVFASNLSAIYCNKILLKVRAVGTTLTAVNTKQLFMRQQTQQWLVSFPLITKRNCLCWALFLHKSAGSSARTLQTKRRSNTLLRSPEDIGNRKKRLKSFLGKIQTERRSKFENLWAVNLGKDMVH